MALITELSRDQATVAFTRLGTVGRVASQGTEMWEPILPSMPVSGKAFSFVFLCHKT